MTKWETAAILAALLPAAMKDLKNRTVPWYLVLSGFGILFAASIFRGDSAAMIGTSMIRSVLITAAALLIVLVSDRLLGKKTLGGGDLRFMALMAFALPLESCLWALLTGLVSGGIVLLSGRALRRPGFPMTPFLLIGAELVILIGI